MNELKPEDVMRALDILDKMDFFQGQRAGRELWNEKPFEVQEQDIADFSQGIVFVKNLVTNALALLREKDAGIAMMAECIERQDKEIAQKDAEIERLKNSITFQVVMPDEKMEEIKSECLARVELDIKEIRAEAITDFSKRMEKALTAQVNASSNEMLAACMWCLDLVKNVENQLKGVPDVESDL